MKWGIIGTGNMGQVLTHAFLQSQLLNQHDLYLTTRTMEKAYTLKEEFPNVQITDNVFDLIEEVDTIFLCVKPLEMVKLLQEIKHVISKDQLLVSITSGISVNQIESIVNCQVARMVPSITNRALSGVSLITFGERVDPQRRELFYKRCKRFSEPIEIEEKQIRIASDMVSCGPAFFAFLAKKYIQEADSQTAITTDEASTLMEKMFVGFGKLLAEKHYSLNELIEKVCVKGGITGVGIEALEGRSDELFKQLIHSTHHKFSEDKKEIYKEVKVQ
ncbi:late competence protein ComER [Gracilibacillus sp. YIM 98692]|uniref:late competence protein ComER n=1 Tax=Gracilibacillus sp. YIM 98692 TaxID=2663532 RepID=UPI0013D2786F|nr:late competence protein ComER [Gracilibacillus sp. YIM 98692]